MQPLLLCKSLSIIYYERVCVFGYAPYDICGLSGSKIFFHIIS